MTPSQEMNPPGGVGQKSKGLAEVRLKELTGAHVDRIKQDFVCTMSRVELTRSIPGPADNALSVWSLNVVLVLQPPPTVQRHT